MAGVTLSGKAITGLLALATLMVFAGLALWLVPLQPGIVALQLAFTPVGFQDVLAHWGATGVARYRAHFPFDFQLLALYGALGWRWVRRSPAFAVLAPGRRRLAAALAPLAAVFDAGENALHLVLTAPAALTAMPDVRVVTAAAVCASGKWLLLAGFAVTLAWTAFSKHRKRAT